MNQHSQRSYIKPPSRSLGISSDINGLLPILQWLDGRLEQAIATVASQQSTESQANSETIEPFIKALNSPHPLSDALIAIRPDSPLAWLHQNLALSTFDLLIVVIALAPELDRRYEQMYAYLQGDRRYKRPTVDLALHLLCATPTEKLNHRVHFASDAPLIKQEILHLVAGLETSKPTILGRELHLDDQIISLLLSQTGLDSRLIGCGKLLQPQVSLENLSLSAKIQEGLIQLTGQYHQANRPLWLYFQGADQAGKCQVSLALAQQVQVPLLSINLSQITGDQTEFEATLNLILREAWLQNAWLYLENLDHLSDHQHLNRDRLLFNALADAKVITILSGKQPLIPMAGSLGIVTIIFAMPEFAQRRNCWQRYLDQAEIDVESTDLDALSDRFRLTTAQIANAIAIAKNTLHWQTACGNDNVASIDYLFAAARSQSEHDLTNLSQKIIPKYGWNDIVLPPPQLALLQELCNEAKYQHLVWHTWGFDSKLSLGKGLNVLFSGAPGTGKTMAAEVIAHELQLDLYKIDLSQIVSKYIGETEKSLNQVFTSASNSNAILFFDEADALFGKRSEVRDAHDRYANIETSYLLQKMEEYEGIAILTTNLRSNMDEAFGRRLRFIIEFTLPSIKERRCIWERICPEQMPRSQDIDFDFLARQFEISGANIRNVVLRAAFLAANDHQEAVNMRHVIISIRREYQKMGKILMLEELGEYANLL